MHGLEYEVPRPKARPSLWVLMLPLAMTLPVLATVSFTCGTPLLQDELVRGDGKSWLRASLWLGLPTGAIMLGGAVVAARVIAAGKQSLKGAAIFALIANVVGIGVVVFGILAAM